LAAWAFETRDAGGVLDIAGLAVKIVVRPREQNRQAFAGAPVRSSGEER